MDMVSRTGWSSAEVVKKQGKKKYTLSEHQANFSLKRRLLLL